MKKDPAQKLTPSQASAPSALIAQARETDLLAINAAVRAGQEELDRDALFATLQVLQQNTRALLKALERSALETSEKLESVA